jgi:6-phosphofructokinase 1
LITRQASRVVPVPFDELIDPMKGRTRVRTVDTSTDAYAAARAMQVRVEGADLEDPKTLARLAEAAHLEPAQVKQRYAPA